MKTIYIVWVGGVATYEGKSKQYANIDYDHWIRLGYEDVILEEVTAWIMTRFFKKYLTMMSYAPIVDLKQT